MANQDPQAIAQEWANRLAQSGAKIERGVRAVSVAPGQAAARQKATYVARVQEKADVWAARVSSVSAGEWADATVSKGVPRIASGAAAAVPKMAAFMGQVLPHIEQGRQALPARGGLEQNIARSVAFQRHMANFRRR